MSTSATHLNGDHLNVVLFSGGRGTSSIALALLKHPQISLTLLVNAYDDGLSTGRLRQFIPGMLGPSDVRKNISRLIPDNEASDQALKEIMEYRLPEKTGFAEALTWLDQVSRLDASMNGDPLRARFLQLKVGQASRIRDALIQFSAYAELQAKEGRNFDFGDCSLGNLVFSGIFLTQGRHFNTAIAAFSDLCRPRARVLNVTDGMNLVLLGQKADGTLLKSEAELVSPQSRSAVTDIYLLPDYLEPSEAARIARLEPAGQKAELVRRHVTPEMSPECRQALQSADLIIYGPGTQHSSLFPSYLTQEMAEVIAANRDAEKIFVGNIERDHEIQSETAQSLVRKFFYYLSRRETVATPKKNLVTTLLFQTDTAGDKSVRRLTLEAGSEEWTDCEIVTGNFEAERGEHSGGRILDQIIGLVNFKAQKRLPRLPHMVSIIVPCLDEARTVEGVLKSLALLDLTSFGLSKEIIFVDGGSKDGSFEIASQVRGVTALQLQGGSGRGLALRRGIDAATGNIAVFFPSDGEYSADDILPLIMAIVTNGFRAVYGSRAIKCVNLSNNIRKIYRGDWIGYWVSKYGGMALSITGLLLLNRFVSDCLTGLKAFDISLLRELDLEGKRLEFETELFAKLGRRGEFILEVPVNFKPRLKSEGKKTTIWDGCRSLWKLLQTSLLWKSPNYQSSSPLLTKKHLSEPF